jgi:hypothetical protein
MARLGIIIALLFTVVVSPKSALAVLGQARSSITLDAETLQAQPTISNSAQFETQTIQSGNQTFKEYVNSNGVVFAFSWSGALVPPDLSQEMGDYYTEYSKRAAQAVQQNPLRGRHPTVISTPDATIYRGGQAKNFHGLAIIQSAMPTGVKLEDLQ